MNHPPRLRLNVMPELERRYTAGDKSALFFALVNCVADQLPAPEWVRSAMMEAGNAVVMLDVTDWNDIFGDPLPRSVQRRRKLPSARADLLLAGPVVDAVTLSRKAGVTPDWTAIASQVTGAHKEQTGEALSLSGGGAKDLYYRTIKRWRTYRCF